MGSLVKRVQDLQRASAAGREQWDLYCKKYFEGCKDPRRHDAASLLGFLEHYEEGYHLTSVASGLRVCMEHSTALREAWTRFMATGSGDADKSLYLHREDFLVRFLQRLAVDHQVAKSKADPEKDLLVGKVKALQRQSTTLVQEWHNLCGDKDPDPLLYTHEELKSFVDAHGKGAFDAEKDQLILKVKAFQRVDREKAQVWRAFMDERSAGAKVVYNPFGVEKVTLQEFVEKHAL